jgi:hypothetical protein
MVHAAFPLDTGKQRRGTRTMAPENHLWIQAAVF